MTNAEINAKIAEMRKLQEEADKVQQSVEAIRNELKAEMDLRHEEMVDTGIHRVFYKPQERTSVDTTKLKKDGLYEKYINKSISLYFKVTDISIV